MIINTIPTLMGEYIHNRIRVAHIYVDEDEWIPATGGYYAELNVSGYNNKCMVMATVPETDVRMFNYDIEKMNANYDATIRSNAYASFPGNDLDTDLDYEHFVINANQNLEDSQGNLPSTLRLMVIIIEFLI